MSADGGGDGNGHFTSFSGVHSRHTDHVDVEEEEDLEFSSQFLPNEAASTSSSSAAAALRNIARARTHVPVGVALASGYHNTRAALLEDDDDDEDDEFAKLTKHERNLLYFDQLMKEMVRELVSVWIFLFIYYYYYFFLTKDFMSLLVHREIGF